MIGQAKLRKKITSYIEDGGFASFSIFTGIAGSGKKTFIRERVCPQLKEKGFGEYWLPDVKIEDVRTMIKMSYKLSNTVFIIPDADTMSVQAKNAMLKVVEELPNENIFIMTLEDINNTLPTIKSRAQVFTMDSYNKNELTEYYVQRPVVDMEELDICVDIAETPYDISILIAMQPTEFYEYVQLVVDNIAIANGANVFKIASKVALKDIDEGYNLRLFWRAIIRECNSRACKCFDDKKDSQGLQYLFWSRETSRVLVKLRTKGINRQMLFDIWILNIREFAMKCKEGAE